MFACATYEPAHCAKYIRPRRQITRIARLVCETDYVASTEAQSICKQREIVSGDTKNNVERMLANQKVVNVFGVVHTAIKLAVLAGIVNSDLEPTFVIHQGTFGVVRGSSLTHTALFRPVHLENWKSGCPGGSMCLEKECEARSLGKLPTTCEVCWYQGHRT